MPNFGRKCVALAAALLTISINSVCFAEEGGSQPIHEQQWIVNFIGEDIAEILLFAAKQDGKKDLALNTIGFKTDETSGNTEKYSYQLICPDPLAKETRDVTLTDYVWSPNNYAPWAQQLIESLHLHPYVASSAIDSKKSAESTKADDSDKATNSDKSKENKRISSALTPHPLDARGHEEAALLCSLFALRETASCFSDVRPALNRIAAHLAIAKALNGSTEYGDAGKLADITLMVLARHEAEAVTKINSFASSSSDAVQTWLRALKIRATFDYRLANFKKASALELLQYGRALADDLGCEYLTEYLYKNKPTTNAIDWLRIGARGLGTVESGHLYCEPGVTAESQSFRQDFQLYKNKKIESSDEADAALSLTPDRCLSTYSSPELQVISWSDVAAFDARHLLDSLFQKYYFEKAYWGVPEQAKESQDYADKYFSKIRLYPLVKISFLWADIKHGDSSLIAQCKTLMTSRPQDINSNLWHRIFHVCPDATELPVVTSWFIPYVLYGTAFDFEFRNFVGEPDISMSEFDMLKSYSPYFAFVIRGWLTSKYPHDSFTSEQVADAYGSLVDVSLQPLELMASASKSDPIKYGKYIEKLAAFQPDHYYELGQFYVDHAQPEKAKKAFEEGIRLGKDSVMKANKCSWLVNYYYDHGEKDKALKLAKFAEEVYSSGGLQTAAKLYERMGNLAKAEELFKADSERYDKLVGLCLFYRRHQAADPKYKSQYDSMIKVIFPSGQIKTDFATLKNPPENGIEIKSHSELTEKFGLKDNEIIVAIENIKVATRDQYFFMLTDAHATKMNFIVWDGKAYRNLEATLPNRKWDCEIEPYHR
jgi:hypothetical protein